MEISYQPPKAFSPIKLGRHNKVPRAKWVYQTIKLLPSLLFPLGVPESHLWRTNHNVRYHNRSGMDVPARYDVVMVSGVPKVNKIGVWLFSRPVLPEIFVWCSLK